MNLIERMLFQPPGGMYREFVGITTHLEPKDLPLYRSLLPGPFDMPARPTVTIFVADYTKVFPWPMARYQEWAVLLKSSYKGEEAWYTVTMPVTAWIPMVGGRHLGFPKHIVDEITVAKDAGICRGRGTDRGAVQVDCEFHPGHSRQLAQWEKELADDEAFFKGDFHCLVPPGRGPRVHRVRIVEAALPKWRPEHGMVTVRAHPSASWAGLVPEASSFPATYNHFTGGNSLAVERLA